MTDRSLLYCVCWLLYLEKRKKKKKKKKDCWVRHKVVSQMKVRQVVVLFQHCPINVAAGELVSCPSLLSFCTNISLYSKNRRLYNRHPTLISPPAPADTIDIQKKMQKFTVAASHIVSACVNKIESQPTKFFFTCRFITWISPFFFTSATAPKFTMQPEQCDVDKQSGGDGPVPASDSRGHTNTAGLSSHALTLTCAGLPLPWVLRHREGAGREFWVDV